MTAFQTPTAGRGDHRRQLGNRRGDGESSCGPGFPRCRVARRAHRIERFADELGGTAVAADVTDDAAVAALADRPHPGGRAGQQRRGAKGLQTGRRGEPRRLALDVETNVIGTLRVTRPCCPSWSSPATA